MAAPAGKMRRVSDDSSSSDEEALRRCQEAVWESKPDRQKDGDGAVPQSKRVVVAEHEHDGNELQVTQGFRTHVAKKLENLLNSCISETQIKTTSCVDSVREEEDDGFRLFSTSVPGQTAEDRPAPARRRPAPSSSDSDSEMESRLKEAAVSVKDLLSSASSCPAGGRHGSEGVKGEKTDAEGEKKKRKKKKKKNAEDCAGSPPDPQRNGENGRSEQEEQQLKVKRKKKKKRKEESESD